jgi:hypothetical protein
MIRMIRIIQASPVFRLHAGDVQFNNRWQRHRIEANIDRDPERIALNYLAIRKRFCNRSAVAHSAGFEYFQRRFLGFRYAHTPGLC